MEKCLHFAVPLWIDRLKHKTFKDFEKRRSVISTAIASKGDVLMYGSKRPGEAGKLFNDLAEGLAWLALIAKGGVTFGEQHWDAEFEKMPDLQKADQRPFQSEAMQAVCEGAGEKAGVVDDAGAKKTGEDAAR